MRQGQFREGTIPWIFVTAILVTNALILATTTWLLSARDQATEVTQGQVLDEFRADLVAGVEPLEAPTTPSQAPTTPAPSARPTLSPADGATVASEAPAAEAPSSQGVPSTPTPSSSPTPLGYRQPQAGVYEYATTGSESVSLMGAKHQYPSRTYASVQVGDGCGWRLELKIVAEHVDEWLMCSDAGWLVRAGHTRTITWFGVTTDGYYDCGEPLVHDGRDVVVDDTITYPGCTDGAGSFADIDVTLLERGSFLVSGDTVQAISVEVVMHSSGTTRGLTTDRYWLAADTGMILHLDRQVDTTSDTQFGKVDYQERATFTLTSLTPST